MQCHWLTDVLGWFFGGVIVNRWVIFKTALALWEKGGCTNREECTDWLILLKGTLNHTCLWMSSPRIWPVATRKGILIQFAFGILALTDSWYGIRCQVCQWNADLTRWWWPETSWNFHFCVSCGYLQAKLPHGCFRAGFTLNLKSFIRCAETQIGFLQEVPGNFFSYGIVEETTGWNFFSTDDLLPDMKKVMGGKMPRTRWWKKVIEPPQFCLCCGFWLHPMVLEEY